MMIASITALLAILSTSSVVNHNPHMDTTGMSVFAINFVAILGFILFGTLISLIFRIWSLR